MLQPQNSHAGHFFRGIFERDYSLATLVLSIKMIILSGAYFYHFFGLVKTHEKGTPLESSLSSFLTP